MRNLPALGLFILILVSFSSASVQWSYLTSSPASGGIAIFNGMAVFTSFDGNIYALSLGSGELSWAYTAGENTLPNPLVVNATSIAFATQSGQVVFLDPTGTETSSFPLGGSPLYIASGGGLIYASFNDSISAYSYGGNVLWSLPLNGSTGPLGYSGGTLYFTSGGDLYSVAPSSGTVNWAVPAEDSFLSVPSVYGSQLYFGATNGRLYAFNFANGQEDWDFQTGGWVMSTPSQLGNAIFFGSNDGYLYSVDTSGNLLFRFKTGDAIWSQPLFYSNGNQTLVVFGSNDGNLYAVDSATGQEVWSFSAGGRLGSAVENNGTFIFGTGRGNSGEVFDVSPSPICSFSWPPEQERIGPWHVDVEGRAYSDSGISRVDVRAGNGDWVTAEGASGWHASLDFTGTPIGPVIVQCRATDNAGNEESGTYSSITLLETGPNAPLQQMYVSAPARVASNQSFNISVTDSRGMGMYGLTFTIDRQTVETGDSPFPLVLGKTAPVQIMVQKDGYYPVTITVAGTGGSSLLAAMIIVVLVVAACAAYLLYGKKLLAKKK